MKDRQFQKNINPDYTLNDLLKGKDLDIIAASLLILGKLKVDSVELFRNSPTIGISLIGKYRTIDDFKENAMDEFLNSNGNMTVDEIFDALSKRMNKRRM
ncbi:hypothetical protein [Paenisporosarcina indica]|uniref:hypothetical protein n=1 Tax=Paenisporosarcina indica TaxID=650093 RepID=UPI00095006AF|nr:hypothetical protein [Paenisporosarcina indica]